MTDNCPKIEESGVPGSQMADNTGLDQAESTEEKDESVCRRAIICDTRLARGQDRLHQNMQEKKKMANALIAMGLSSKAVMKILNITIKKRHRQ